MSEILLSAGIMEEYSKHSKTIGETLSMLKSIISEYDYKNILFIGNSSGGYAAILFGTLLSVSKILAFVPQTFLNRCEIHHNDNIWGKEIDNAYLLSTCNGIFDLKKVLSYNTSSRISIYYDKTRRVDRKHAEWLSRFHLVTLYPFEVGGHNVIRTLRESGDLKEIIRTALEFSE